MGLCGPGDASPTSGKARLLPSGNTASSLLGGHVHGPGSLSGPAGWKRSCALVKVRHMCLSGNITGSHFPCGYLNYLVSVSCSVVSNSLQPHGLQPTRLLYPWNSPGKNTGEACHVLLQGMFLTPGFNPCLWVHNHYHQLGSSYIYM